MDGALELGGEVGNVTGGWGSILAVAGSFGVAVLILWGLLAVALLRGRPEEATLKEALRLFPDVARLVRRLAGDPDLPRSVRGRVVFLVVYLALPIDLVPDFIPVLGWADDVILTLIVLRSVVRRAGPSAVSRHWPGTAAGLAVLWRIAALPGEPPAQLT